MNDSAGTRGREAYRSITETMNGHEELNQWRGREPGATCSTPLSLHSHNASGFTSSSSSFRPGRRPKGLVPEEVSGHHSPDAGFGIGVHGNTGHRPSSAEFSRNTSNSGSPISSKGSLDCLQGRSVSLSSDDVVGLSHEGSRLSQTSLIPRSSTLPCDSPSAQRSSLRPASHRPASPGSEMVSLEEFLQESNALSPPTVHTGSREDLMTDFFARSTRSAPLRDDPKTPTSYVTPTIKTTPEQDGLSRKPGHSVKPNVRLNETSTPPFHSQTLPNRGGGHRPSPQHQSSPRGGVGSGRSLSRTFSLASADLLQSNGPNSYRTDGGSPCQNDVVLRRSGGVARERPMSARMAGDPGHLSVDPRRLSFAPPRDNPLRSPPALHSSSVSMQAEREYVDSRGSHVGGVRSGSAQSRPSSHRGEVAMVTPVRAVSALRLKDLEEEPQELRQADSPVLKTADTPNVSNSAKEQATSKPASPDPNNDPQTVWYEYGCV